MNLHLNDALSRYESTLATIEGADTLNQEDVLAALIARDLVQSYIHQGPLSPENVLVLSKYDNYLRALADRIISTVKMSNLRITLEPSEKAWWWFLDKANKCHELAAIKSYEQVLKALEKESFTFGNESNRHSRCKTNIIKKTDLKPDLLPEYKWLSTTQILLELYLTRDLIQHQIEVDRLTVKQIVRLSQLDEDYQICLAKISQKANHQYLRKILSQVDEVRSLISPPPEAWWWFPNVKIHWWDGFDQAWNTLTLVCLTASFSLLTDTATRLLIGGPGFLSGFAVITQASLALLGGGSLTKSGKRLVEDVLKLSSLPKHYWQEVRFLGSTFILVVFIGIQSLLPLFSKAYNNVGFEDYKNGNFDSAEANYQRAIALHPNSPEVHYNLGQLYEDLQDYEKAREEYVIATKGGLIHAYNNLARLEILSGNHIQALSLLRSSQVLNYIKDPNADEDLKFFLYKNTAWALQHLGFHQEVVEQLRRAINLKPKQASAYCLLAQSFEEIKDGQHSLEAWQNCIKYSKELRNPEEYEWFFRARKKIQGNSGNLQ